MNWKSRIGIFILLLFAAMPAAAQGVRYDNFLLNEGGRTVSGATVTVCTATATGTPCSPTVSIFSDSALTVPITSLLTDANGNYGFWVAPGHYKLTLTGNNTQPITLDITPGCIPGASGCSGSGSGNVVGPNSSVSTDLPTFSDTTGKVLGDSGIAVTEAALKPVASDAVQFVSVNGNDSNDGRSMGSPKLTMAAAYAALPTCTMGFGYNTLT